MIQTYAALQGATAILRARSQPISSARPLRTRSFRRYTTPPHAMIPQELPRCRGGARIPPVRFAHSVGGRGYQAHHYAQSWRLGVAAQDVKWRPRAYSAERVFLHGDPQQRTRTVRAYVRMLQDPRVSRLAPGDALQIRIRRIAWNRAPSRSRAQAQSEDVLILARVCITCLHTRVGESLPLPPPLVPSESLEENRSRAWKVPCDSPCRAWAN